MKLWKNLPSSPKLIPSHIPYIRIYPYDTEIGAEFGAYWVPNSAPGAAASALAGFTSVFAMISQEAAEEPAPAAAVAAAVPISFEDSLNFVLSLFSEPPDYGPRYNNIIVLKGF